MNMAELYSQILRERHPEVVVLRDRLFFDGEEYVISPDGELKLVHSHKDIEQKLAQIGTKLGVKRE